MKKRIKGKEVDIIFERDNKYYYMNNGNLEFTEELDKESDEEAEGAENSFVIKLFELLGEEKVEELKNFLCISSAKRNKKEVFNSFITNFADNYQGLMVMLHFLGIGVDEWEKRVLQKTTGKKI